MAKHTRQYVAEKILSIEQNHDVLNFQIDGIHLWPLIRYNLSTSIANIVFADSIVEFSRAFSLVKSNLNDEFSSKNIEMEPNGDPVKFPLRSLGNPIYGRP